MATNDFQPFAIGTGANVESQAAWLADPVLSTGFVTGIAPSAQVGKAVRQPSVVSAAVAQLACDVLNQNVSDNGSFSPLVCQIFQLLLQGSYFLDVGSASALLTSNPYGLTFPAPAVGLKVSIRVAQNPTGASTFNWMGTGAFPIVYEDASPTTALSFAPGGIIELVYAGGGWLLQTITPTYINSLIGVSSGCQFLEYAGDPNGHVAGTSSAPQTYCYNTVGTTLYACITSGSTSTAVWRAVNQGSFLNYQVFTAGTNIYTPTLGTGLIHMRAVSGGGSGGGVPGFSSGYISAASPGGAGAFLECWLGGAGPSSIPATMTLTIGVSATGTSNANGSGGGEIIITWAGSGDIVMTGGAGGTAGPGAGQTPPTGQIANSAFSSQIQTLGGVVSTLNFGTTSGVVVFNSQGANGYNGIMMAGNCIPGIGANSPFGAGGENSNNGNGGAGGGYGSGGGGAGVSTSGGPYAGGNGGAAIVSIEEYY